MTKQDLKKSIIHWIQLISVAAISGAAVVIPINVYQYKRVMWAQDRRFELNDAYNAGRRNEQFCRYGVVQTDMCKKHNTVIHTPEFILGDWEK